MHQLKIWPVIFSLLACGCSLQHHTERAERIWLNAGSTNSLVHRAELRDSVPTDEASTVDHSFLTASGADTYYSGQTQSSAITELSGVAAVIGQRNKYWGVNDSGNQASLFAFDLTGRHIADIDLSISNRDWEDLATFTLNGENWIALADTGDNLQRHAVSTIYIFRQPDVNNPPDQLAPFREINFSYEGGPRNVESMAVSVAEGKIYLIAKDDSDPALYTLPLVPVNANSQDQNTVAIRVGQLASLNASSDDVWWERTFARKILFEATAADINVDNRTAIVANYRHVYLFKRDEAESWAQAFSRSPLIISSHRMQQSEAVAFAAKGDQILVGSEGINAPLLVIRPVNSALTAAAVK